MSVSIPLVVAMAVLYACGVYLLLEKSVTRVILGVVLIGNATNLLLLILAGRPSVSPIAGRGSESTSDPLPQILILTAIVITFAVSAFLMALVYRSWRLAREDELTRDVEDVAVASREAPEPEDAEVDEDSEFARDDTE